MRGFFDVLTNQLLNNSDLFSVVNNSKFSCEAL